MTTHPIEHTRSTTFIDPRILAATNAKKAELNEGAER